MFSRPAEPERLIALRAALARRRVFSWARLRVLVIVLIWSGVAVTLALIWLLHDLPRPEDGLAAIRRPSLVLQDSVGRVIARYGDVVGDPLHLADLPAFVPAAAVAVEDKRFWSHGALDYWGILRALSVDLLHLRVVQGGSTLTQQVAKTLFLSNARTWRRKLQELVLTLWLEAHFSKAEILEIWLNRVYFGAGAWGIDAAAHTYFNESARRLQLWQAAVLVGLPRAPSRFNPRTDPHAAAARGREVLAAMVAAGALTQPEAAAEAARMRFPHAPPGAGWFADWVAGQTSALVPEGTDAVLRTTLDGNLQTMAQGALAAMLAGPGARLGASQGAVVALDARDGAVRVLVGGREYGPGAFDRATLARRQPGSAFKPFVFLAALEHGLRPDDMVLDGPLRIGGWSPVDFEPGWRGEVTLRQALAQSLNTAAVRVMLRAGGATAVASVAHRLGIADKLPDVPALALGTGEVGVMELTAAYAPFFNGGRRVTPFGLPSGPLHGVPHVPPAQVVDAARAAAMQDMLREVVLDGTGRAAALPGRDIAGKTGTTQDNRDAWFIGAVGNTLIGVWIGNDNGAPMKAVMGGTLPAQLFHQLAAAASR